MKQLKKVFATLFLLGLLISTSPVIGQTADNTTANTARTDNDNDDDSGKWGLAGLLGLLGLLGLRRKDDVNVNDRRGDISRK